MTAEYLTAPLVLVVFGGLAIMLADVLSKKAELAFLTAVTLATAGALAAACIVFDVSPRGLPETLTRYLAFDRMALFFDAVICVGGAFSALLAGGYLQEHQLERGEFYVLLLFSAFGGMVLAHSADLLTLFIGLETMSLGAYAMVAFRRTSARAAEGAAKYFLLGGFAAAVLLFGSALLYGATGHTDFAGIAESVSGGQSDVPLTIVAMLLLIVGLTFKVSAAPFHMWTPDAYEGAVTPATTFMSVTVKSAAFAVLARVLVGLFGDELSASGSTGWPPVIAGLAALTMVIGNVAAVSQSSVKRMLAYSSIAHAGYALVALCASFRVGEAGVSALLFYLAAYTVSNVLAFGSLILMGSYGKEVVSYDDLAGVGRRHPLAALPFVVGVLSLMGMPPTAGFFAKYYAFQSAVLAGDGMVWLAVLGVITSAVSAFYYLKVIVFMFMKEPHEGAPVAVPMRSGYVSTALTVSGIAVMALGLAPGVWVEAALEAARAFVS